MKKMDFKLCGNFGVIVVECVDTLIEVVNLKVGEKIDGKDGVGKIYKCEIHTPVAVNYLKSRVKGQLEYVIENLPCPQATSFSLGKWFFNNQDDFEAVFSDTYQKIVNLKSISYKGEKIDEKN